MFLNLIFIKFFLVCFLINPLNNMNVTISQQNETINKMAISLCNLGQEEWC